MLCSSSKLERTFVLFEDILGLEIAIKCADQLSANFAGDTLIMMNSKESIFNSLKAKIGGISSKWIILISADITEWNKDNWNYFLNQASSKSNAVEINDQKPINLSSGTLPSFIACFETLDLSMALDQNYRPNFEQIHEAYKTFGFQPNFTSVFAD